MTARVRVLVVDDSAFARKVLRELLSAAADLEVVGIARDGLEALEKVSELKPDVMTLDLVMPNLDGLGVLDGLDPEHGPRVIVVSTSPADSALALGAMERGAVELVRKPTALATDRLYEMRDELIAKVRIAVHARRRMFGTPPAAPKAPALAATRRIVVLGTSTGGPQALSYLVPALPANFPVPIAVALHIPPGYTGALAERLNGNSAIEVLEAHEGIALCPGRVVIAAGGSHLKIRSRNAELLGTLSRFPADTPHFPSVDVLFESAVEQCGAGVVGLVMTGMGEDGKRGAGLIRRAGGVVLTESERSCVVYGMPRSVVEAGLSDGAAPLEGMAELLRSRV